MSQVMTKKCKHCQTEIDKKAKVCPNCKRKQGGALKFIIIAIVFIGIIGALTQQDDEPKSVDNKDNTQQTDGGKSEDTKADPTKAPEKTSFAVGEAVELKDVLVTLTGITHSEGSDFNKPADGNIFTLCEFTIENNSDKDITVSSMLSFEAYCDSYSVNQSIAGLLEKGDKNQLDGNVAAGKKMNGVIAYELPSDWKELEINFTPDFWSSKDITFVATR